MNQTPPIFGEMAPEEREKLLEAHCVAKERTTFTQDLTAEEYFALQSDFTRGHIDLARMEDDFKKAKDEWTTKIKAKEEGLKKFLEQINAGRKQTVGILYSIRDLAKGLMLRYNKHGELIESRPLKDEERQTRAFIEGPAGTVANPDERSVTDIDHEEVKTGGSAEEQIEGMYQGPTIAGSAPAPGSESLEGSGILDDVSRSGNGLGPLPEEKDQAGFDYQQREQETQGSKFSSGAGSGEENGKAWDDRSQVRANPESDKATEEGAAAAKKGKGGRKKKSPQTPENPSGQEPE